MRPVSSQRRMLDHPQDSGCTASLQCWIAAVVRHGGARDNNKLNKHVAPRRLTPMLCVAYFQRHQETHKHPGSARDAGTMCHGLV